MPHSTMNSLQIPNQCTTVRRGGGWRGSWSFILSFDESSLQEVCFEIEKPPEISPLLPVYSKERFFRKRRWLSDHREIDVRYLAAVYAFQS